MSENPALSHVCLTKQLRYVFEKRLQTDIHHVYQYHDICMYMMYHCIDVS